MTINKESLTDGYGKLVQSDVGHQVVGSDHVPEPPHEELAGQAGVLLDASLQIGGRKCY